MKEVLLTIRKFMEERGWHTRPPVDNAKSIMIEGAELLECFQFDHLTINEVKGDSEKIEKISKEIADVLIYTLHLADNLSIDPELAINKKLEHAGKKYPAELVKNNDAMRGKLQKDWRDRGIN